MEEIWRAVVVIVVAMVGGNGLIVVLINRYSSKRDKVAILAKLNNTQAGQIVVMSKAVDSTLDVQVEIIDALEAKGLLNGDAVKIKANINSARNAMRDYEQKMRDNSLFFKEA